MFTKLAVTFRGQSAVSLLILTAALNGKYANSTNLA